MENLFFSNYVIDKGFNSGLFLVLNETISAYIKHLPSLFLGFIFTFLFFIHSGESVFDAM